MYLNSLERHIVTTTIPVQVEYQQGKHIRQLIAFSDRRGLEILSDMLLSDSDHFVQLTVLTSNPAQDDVAILKHLRITPLNALLNFQVEGDAMIITGNRESRRTAAEYIEYLRLQSSSIHGADIHFSYFPGSTYLCPDTISLVICKL